MVALAYPRWWWAGGVLLVAVVVAGSLAPGEYVQDLFIWGDKIEHALGYGALALWFSGLLPRRRYPWIVVALVLLGVALEGLQGSMSFGRFADFADLLANLVGILLGMGLALAGLGQWTRWMERRVLGVRLS